MVSPATRRSGRLALHPATTVRIALFLRGPQSFPYAFDNRPEQDALAVGRTHINQDASTVMLPEKVRLPLPHIFIAICAIFWSVSLSAENIALVYTGSSFTQNSDLRITQPGVGTDISIRDVKWNADPFKPAPYYGLRLIHFLDQYPNWGIGLDYTHYKMYAEPDRVARVSGTWKGATVNADAPADRYVQHFEISHGVNMLSVIGIYRWRSAADKLRPYLGGGLTYYVPHSENTVDHRSHATGYESSGGGYQLLGGVQYQLTRKVGIFAEAKFNSGTAKVDIADGRAETPLRTFHVLTGLSFSF